tara:strand:- start:31828 stop:32022 length:195 start_codon:yes stop_codon:yes gene_type:complete
MCERFNSGAGGYTCDGDDCNLLLWAGVGGLNKPEKRQYIYSVKEEDIITTVDDKAYCSEECYNG